MEADLWTGGWWTFPACSRWRPGCAKVIEQHNRRPVADRPMGALLVVVLAPILQLFSGGCKTQESMRVETFGSEATVEGLNALSVGFPGLEKSSVTPRW